MIYKKCFKNLPKSTQVIQIAYSSSVFFIQEQLLNYKVWSFLKLF